MAYAGGTATRADRTKALIGVAAVHVALGVALLSGLTVTMARQVADHLATFDVHEVPAPPPVKPPPPKPSSQRVKKAAGAPAPKAEAAPVVAPPTKLPVPSPVPAVKAAGTGSASTSGAALAGNGTGAGGYGNGPGGGADTSGFTPARQITTIPNREYRNLAASGVAAGTVGITLRVNPDGSVSDCRIARSSGNGYADATMCQLATDYVRFRPALDAFGRPVAQDITWFPRWWRP